MLAESARSSDPGPGETFVNRSQAQAVVYYSGAPIVAYSGRIGSAKSRTALEAADRDCRLWPRNKVAMCRKKAVDLFGSILDDFLENVVHPNQRDEWKPGRIGGATMFYPNGSRMVWFGLDDPGKALGAQYGSIYVDQAEQLDMPEVETIEKRARLRLPNTVLEDGTVLPLRRRIVYLFNPSGDHHWANLRFGFKAMQPSRDPETWTYRKIVRTDEPRKLLSGVIVPPGKILYEVVIAHPMDNVEHLPEDYQLVLTEQTGPEHDRMVLGLWGSFKGQWAPSFSERTHVRDDPYPEWEWNEWGGYPPPWWKRYRCVDFGYENPFVMAWLTRVPADHPVRPNAWIDYQEIYRTKRIVSEHAKQAKAWDLEEVEALNRGVERWNDAHPEKKREPLRKLSFAMQVCDHDAEDRATLESEGIVMDPAVKDRSSGREAFGKAINRNEIIFMRGARRDLDPELDPRRRRMEEPKPTCTWEEIAGLKFPDKPPANDTSPKDDLVKKNDHGFDAVRYLLRTFKDRGDIRAIPLVRNQPRDDEDD